MTRQTDPFEAEPDRELGALLRAHYAVEDDGGRFAARVLRALGAGRDDTPMEILARWARPGMVAAAGAALAFGLWLQRTRTADEGQTAFDLVPSAETVLASVVEGR